LDDLKILSKLGISTFMDKIHLDYYLYAWELENRDRGYTHTWVSVDVNRKFSKFYCDWVGTSQSVIKPNIAKESIAIPMAIKF
jgi:hypothetical protein